MEVSVPTGEIQYLHTVSVKQWGQPFHIHARIDEEGILFLRYKLSIMIANHIYRIPEIYKSVGQDKGYAIRGMPMQDWLTRPVQK
jgi:hypothetical protein